MPRCALNDFLCSIVVPPINTKARQHAPETAKPTHRKMARNCFPSRDGGDFEAAISGKLDEERVSSGKKQKRAHHAGVAPSPVSGKGGKVEKVPITPRHRVCVPGKPLTPKSQPGTPSSRVDSVQSALGPARSIFARGTAPGQLVGREEEREKLSNYLSERIKGGTGGCLYISGPPGTGKSAFLDEILAGLNGKVNQAYVNCMVIKDPKGIYGTLVGEFWDEDEMGELLSKEGTEELERLFLGKQSGRKGVYVVVLDEIDHLLTKDQETLYSLFEWSLASNSRLILIGIANALDLTDRFLPRLKARNLKPQLLPFHPYSAQQIAEVIIVRLRSLLPEDAPDKSYVPYIHPAAIQLCARKIAAHTGDIRKAFDMCRRGLELLDSELKEKARKEYFTNFEDKPFLGLTPLAVAVERMPLGESSPSSMNIRQSASTNPLTPSKPKIVVDYNPLSGPRVTIGHIARISSAAFGGSAVSRVKSLNLQQKAVLCACCVHETRTSSAPTMRELYKVYRGLCNKDKLLAALTNTEFRDVVGGLESAGVVGLSTVGAVGSPSKKGRSMTKTGTVGALDERRVSCLVREGELTKEVEGVGLLVRMFRE